MSLINEALKKAQRQRNEAAELAAPMPGGGGRPKPRGHGLSTQSLVLLAAVSIALFVVCVVVSVIWINRPSPTQTLLAKSLAPSLDKSTSQVSTATPAPIIVPLTVSPTLPEPAAATTTAPLATRSSVVKPTPVQAAPATPTAPTMSSARSAPVSDLATSARADSLPAAPRELAPSFARATDPITPASPPLAEKFDGHIQSLVERFRVAGIRASGADSKVLLNERVYKINDIVDRASGLRLTQVTNDSLTFTTPDGITYVKNF